MPAPDDPFLHGLYDARGDSRVQRRLRRLCPLPIGTVLIQTSAMDEAGLRQTLRAIRGVGITNLKQFHFMGRHPLPLHDAERIALEEGVIPYWYGVGGWQEITPDLCRTLGIDPALPPADIQADRRMVAYQIGVLQARAARRADKGEPPPSAGSMGEPARLRCAILPEQLAEFVQWLRGEYGTVAACLDAYKMFASDPTTTAWEAIAAPFVRAGNDPAPPGGWADFRRVRDVLRFQADRHFVGIRETAAWHLAWDADEPVRAGCHLIFENQAISGWDFEWQAQAIKEAGSFYASFHPAHHLTEVGGELDIPCYLTARLVADFAKGGWPAMWESVGGPTQYSGTHSYGFDGDDLARCLLSYLAAGLKGVGIWCWNARDWGWETGEYALCDLTGKPTARAHVAGAFARACETWRWELWEARDEPLVGVLYSWENDAAFARLSMGGYPVERLSTFAVHSSEARVGAGRALIRAGVPFEFVTPRDLAAGLAPRYRTIFVPHTLCLEAATLSTLLAYARAGGRVVVDAPTLLVRADDGLLWDTRQGSVFEQLFGWEHADRRDTFNHPVTLDGAAITGQTFDVNVTAATVVARFSDGRPAILHHRVGAGGATGMAFEASRLCHRPGNDAVEALLAQTLLAGHTPPWQVRDESGNPVPDLLVYRRVAPRADHYFLVNPTPADLAVTLLIVDRPRGYLPGGVDCLTGAAVSAQDRAVTLVVPARAGRWVRLARVAGDTGPAT